MAKEKGRHSFIDKFYFYGICAWIIGWIVLVYFMGGEGLRYLRESQNWLYFFAFFVGLWPLISNRYHWLEEPRYGSYSTEVKIIEFVERNGNYLIFAFTALSILAQAIISMRAVNASIMKEMAKPVVLPVEFLIFIFLAVIFVVGCVLPLIWAPPKNGDARDLAQLRHFKTVFYSYALGCTIGAVIALIKLASGF